MTYIPPTEAQLAAADVDYRAASPADHAAFRRWCLEQSKAMPINDYAWLAWRKATEIEPDIDTGLDALLSASLILITR
jgi:hypothetical protein